MTQAKINARTFIDKDPNVKTTDEEESRSEVLNKYASFITNIYVDDNERTNDMEDLESFLGFAIPRLTWPQAKTHGTQTGQEGQNSAASEQIQAANDTSESPPHGCEVYYCPGVDDHEVDTSRHNHTDETLKLYQPIIKRSSLHDQRSSCEKNIDSSIESSNNSNTNDAKERHKEGIKSVWNSYTQGILIPS